MINIKKMVATCENCGSKMRKHDCDTFICDDCGSSYDYNDDFDEWEFHDVEDVEYSTGYINFYKNAEKTGKCKGCPSDMYPECQLTCNLFK